MAKYSHPERTSISAKEVEPQRLSSKDEDTHEDIGSDMPPPEDSRPTVS